MRFPVSLATIKFWSKLQEEPSSSCPPTSLGYSPSCFLGQSFSAGMIQILRLTDSYTSGWIRAILKRTVYTWWCVRIRPGLLLPLLCFLKSSYQEGSLALTFVSSSNLYKNGAVPSCLSNTQEQDILLRVLCSYVCPFVLFFSRQLIQSVVCTSFCVFTETWNPYHQNLFPLFLHIRWKISVFIRTFLFWWWLLVDLVKHFKLPSI